MKANKWVAVLVTGSVLATAVPVSAQFGGLGSLKKKLETVAKELEKPKPAPQPQPTAPPQSRPATSQGGYASSAPQPQPTARPTPPQAPAPIAVPVRTQQVTAPATPVVRQAVTNEVVATEAWRCVQEPDATAIKIEFSYLKDPTGQRRGFFKETYASAYDDEGNKLPADVERLGGKGTFTSRGANYQLKFEDPERGVINMAVGGEHPENGFVHSTTRYDSEDPSLDDIKSLAQKFSDAEIKQFERDSDENPDGGMPLKCALIKPIFSKYSFEDFSVQSPASYERYMGANAKPKLTREEREYKVNRYLDEAVEDGTPDFAKYYIVAWTGDGFNPSHALVDVRTGAVFHDFLTETDAIGWQFDFINYVNSKLIISLSVNDLNNSCFVNYSTWTGNAFRLLESEKLGSMDLCRLDAPNDNGSYLKENFIQLIEDQIIRGERRVPAKTAQ